MQIGKDKMVSIHYTLKDEEGSVLDSSEGRDPLDYLHGCGQIIPGLENVLEGKSEGDEVSVVLEPEEGYGPRDEDLLYEVPKDQFDTVGEVEVGMQFRVGTDQGVMIMNVARVNEDSITLDANHPLAGRRLSFDVSVVGVREATEDELAARGHGDGCAC